MEEEKAAAYYNEMLRKGGGAARLKQGLGFSDSGPSSNPNYALSFVKADPALNSQAESESVLASIRNKLKKHSHDDADADDGDTDRSSRRERGRHCSPELDRDRDRYHRNRNRRTRISRSRSRSRSRSPRCHRSRDASIDDDDDDGYGRFSKKSSSRRQHRNTRSRSPESDQSICPTAASRNDEQKVSKKSSVRGSSPEPCSRKYKSRDHHHSRSREDRDGSPFLDNKGKFDSRKENTKSTKREKLHNYSTLIPGYDGMTAAEKVKARMKFQLSETVAKDTLKGTRTEWERFDFNRDAPLDDDAKLDYFGDGTGALDDTGFLQNTGSTLLSSASQARREAQIQAAHDAAIFGPPPSMSGIQTQRDDHTRFSLKELDEDINKHKEEQTPPITNLVSEQVLSMQQGSWRQRATKLKQERSASTIT